MCTIIQKRSLLLAALLCSLEMLDAQPRPVPSPHGNSAPVNYIRTWEAVKPTTDPSSLTTSTAPTETRMTTQYFDGLGRPIQTVVKQGSLITGGSAADIISTTLYDELGRESYQYLPSPANNTGGNTHIDDGMFKLNPFQQQAAFYGDPNGVLKGQGETYFYGHTKYEASPLNRVTETFAPGNSWMGTSGQSAEAARKSVKTKYYINTAADGVRIWNVTNAAVMGNFGSYSSPGAYSAGELYKTITVDEEGHQVIEFKDKEGQIVLKKVQLTAAADNGTGSNHTGWLCTYYIYDDLNQLRCVIQPRGVELIAANWVLTNATILAEQCFRYEYDQRQRMIVKKVPGAGEVNMVYDKRDRLVMTQDASLKTQNKWMISKYDVLNRPVETGLWNSTATASTHRTNAAGLPEGQVEYPATGSGYEDLTHTYYDDYTWTGPSGSPITNSSYESTWNSYLSAASTTVYPYPVANAKSDMTRSRITGSKIKILGTSTYLYTMLIYDDKGRVIQAKSTNATGGTDVITTQYGWQGLPVIVVQKQQKADAGPQTITTVTKTTYDELGRVVKTEQKQAHSGLNGGAMSAYTTLSELEYDALGQVKTKTLAPEYNNNAGLEKLTYDYNIRGWLLGANREYITQSSTPADKHFGFDLGYDKSGVLGTYTAQYKGNISGTIWKSAGDGEKRKYDFSYDAVNRIMKADFGQYTGSAFNTTAGVNFSSKMGNGTDPNTAYDANGNIKAMTQNGLVINASPVIDQLTYTYNSNSNKLLKVVDAITADNKLGDFHDGSSGSGNDYTYDANGNLTKDANKAISSITYNYLNLPEVITVTGKGTITYTYDAAGNKLKKVTVDNAVSPSKTTTTLYIGGAVYENNELQFIAHSEGRIRPVKDANNNLTGFANDYFLKDHLGNVRMVLTEEEKQDMYPPASMETAQASVEEALYDNISETRVAKPAGYPNDTYTNPNDKVAKTNGDGNKIGPSIVLKVMAGDKFNLRVSSWYKTNGANPGNPNSMAAGLVAAFINSLTGIGGFEHGSEALAELQNSGVVPTAINSFLGTQPAPASTKPKAYLNWVLLDEQFQFVLAGSGAEQVGNDQEFKVHVKNDMSVSKSGYLYVFVGNETPNVDVYFDNLQITHARGSILEETHYYPFGLQMAGISSKALNNVVENKYKFNGGSEINSTFDVNIYETLFRGYDYQTGRFHQIDPLAEITPSWGAYAFVQNNPMLYSDPLGLDTIINNEVYQWDGGYMDEIIINMPSSGGGDGFFGFGWGSATGQFGSSANPFSDPVTTTSGGGSGQGQQSNEGFDADRTNLALGALGNSLGVQGGILDYGVRTNFKSARTISEFNKLRPKQQAWRQMATYGRTGQTYMKGLTNTTRGLGAIQGGVIVYDLISNSQIEASNILDGIVTGVSFVPGWGWIVGGVYYGADLMTRSITGQSIGHHLDNAVEGPLVEW